MRKGILSMMAGSFALAALAAGCAHGNGASGKNAVRVVTSAQDVTGCEKLTQVRLSGTWTKSGGKAELEELVRSKGGNLLLLDASENSGVAYRCAGGTGTGAP